MATKIVYICDRCGKSKERVVESMDAQDDFYDEFFEVGFDFLTSQNYDLCKECNEKEELIRDKVFDERGIKRECGTFLDKKTDKYLMRLLHNFRVNYELQEKMPC